MISAQQIRHWLARHTSLPLPRAELPVVEEAWAYWSRWEVESWDPPISRAVERRIRQGWEHRSFGRKLWERQWGSARPRLWNNCRFQSSEDRDRVGIWCWELVIHSLTSCCRGWGKISVIMEVSLMLKWAANSSARLPRLKWQAAKPLLLSNDSQFVCSGIQHDQTRTRWQLAFCLFIYT